jgi:DNA-3-methyladenine glycosylase II
LTDGRLDQKVLSALPDDELMAELTVIPGIGPWTVQGALLVALEREDVVLPGDLALRKAVQAAYRLDHRPSEQEVLAIAEKWRPYRSLATSYLFSVVESAEPAETSPVKAAAAARPPARSRAPRSGS